MLRTYILLLTRLVVAVVSKYSLTLLGSPGHAPRRSTALHGADEGEARHAAARQTTARRGAVARVEVQQGIKPRRAAAPRKIQPIVEQLPSTILLFSGYAHPSLNSVQLLL